MADGQPLTPEFSVIIPTYARAASLGACLRGLATLDFPADRFEVIVSDDGTPFSLESVLAPMRERLQIRLVSHPNGGPAAARNRGAAVARGTYLAFLDDDGVPARDWLTVLADRHGRAADHLLAGRSVNALPANPFSTASQLIVTYAHADAARRPQGSMEFNATNLSMPACRFHEIQGFDASLRTCEDYDFCIRWQHAGFPAAFVPEAVVYHAHDLTLPGFLRQHFRYGRGLLRHRFHAAKGTGSRPRIRRPAYYMSLIRFPLAELGGARAWAQMALVGLSQVATVAGAAREGLSLGLERTIGRLVASVRG